MKNISNNLVVAKAGTNFLLQEGVFEDMAAQTVALFREGIYPVWISSGAVGFGRKMYTRLSGQEFLLDEKREAAGVGARHLLNAWGNAFEPYGMDVAQVWVTYEPNGVISNANDIKEKIMFYVAHGIVPIINYNDVVSSTELELGDNDRLAVLIAELIGAGTLLLLTEIGGVYSLNSDGSLDKRYREIDCKSRPVCSSETSSGGNGGMGSKLEEAVRSYANGARRVSIAGSDTKEVFVRLVHGEPVGTMIGTSNVLYQ